MKAKSDEHVMAESREIIAILHEIQLFETIAEFQRWRDKTIDSTAFHVWLSGEPDASIEKARQLMRALLQVKILSVNPEQFVDNFRSSTARWKSRPEEIAKAITACESARDAVQALYAEPSPEAEAIDEIVRNLREWHEHSLVDSATERIAAFVGLDPQLIGKRGGASPNRRNDGILRGMAVRGIAHFVSGTRDQRYSVISKLLAEAGVVASSQYVRSCLARGHT